MLFDHRPEWSAAGDALVARLLDEHAQHGLTSERLGLVVIGEAREGSTPPGFSYSGDWTCYPCSLVKAFHLVHALAAIEAGAVTAHSELDRAIRDMILWSSNTATNYVMDLLTGTTGDTLLSGPEWDRFVAARRGLDAWFEALGWPEWRGATIMQKLMDDTRYGRERQLAGAESEHLNALNPALCARLMLALFTPGALPLSEAARQRAVATLARDRSGPDSVDPRFQVATYLGGGLPPGPLWSKAGHTEWTGDPRASWFKHDMVRIAPPGQPARIIVVMTQGTGLARDSPQAFPRIGATIWEAFAGLE